MGTIRLRRIRPRRNQKRTATSPDPYEKTRSYHGKNTTAFHTHEKSTFELVVVDSSSISYPEHIHISVFVVGLVRSGTVTLRRQRNKTTLGAGDTFVLYPYHAHELSASGDYSLLSLCIDKNLLLNRARKFPLPKLRSFLAGLEEKRVISEMERKSLVEASEHLAVCAHSGGRQGASAGLEALREYIETRPEAAITLSEMSLIARISKFHLVRSFCKEFGLTPRRFLIQNRVRKARRECLSRSALTAVALSAGFYDQSHFIRDFKRLTGLTPKQYRRARQK